MLYGSVQYSTVYFRTFGLLGISDFKDSTVHMRHLLLFKTVKSIISTVVRYENLLLNFKRFIKTTVNQMKNSLLELKNSK